MKKKKRTTKKNNQISENQLVLTALAVMNDEFNDPVPVDEINFCLRIDFKYKINDSQLLSSLSHAISAKYVEKTAKGYRITPQGASIADGVLKTL